MSLSNHNPISEKWKAIATIAKDEALTLPPGKDRDALIKKARQLATACHINEWLASPGFKVTTGK
ncbi:MAG: hypothetical protein Q7V17_04995 [Afipia sp.]|nr:hypothetical protein [Afipia sp.]